METKPAFEVCENIDQCYDFSKFICLLVKSTMLVMKHMATTHGNQQCVSLTIYHYYKKENYQKS